jgi:signal transduction protein with GAF and PtsI domain
MSAEKSRIGAMIEVPSIVYIIAELARRVDFFALGTNDLTQFLLAVDRSDTRVQGFRHNLHTALLHVVGDIVQRAHHHNKPVSVCGEMAGDPASALLLLGLGVDSLSMIPSSLPRVKWTIRSFKHAASTQACRRGAQDRQSNRYPTAIESCPEGRRPWCARARSLIFQNAKAGMYMIRRKTPGFATHQIGVSPDPRRILKTN